MICSRPTLSCGKMPSVLEGRNLVCPKCGNHSKLVTSEQVYSRKGYGWFWACSTFPVCHTYVGCHRKTQVPLGTMADPILRKWRHQAHSVFDKLWRNGTPFDRNGAYRWMAEQMGVKEFHIGTSDTMMCQTVISIVKKSQYFEGVNYAKAQGAKV